MKLTVVYGAAGSGKTMLLGTLAEEDRLLLFGSDDHARRAFRKQKVVTRVLRLHQCYFNTGLREQYRTVVIDSLIRMKDLTQEVIAALAKFDQVLIGVQVPFDASAARDAIPSRLMEVADTVTVLTVEKSVTRTGEVEVTTKSSILKDRQSGGAQTEVDVPERDPRIAAAHTIAAMQLPNRLFRQRLWENDIVLVQMKIFEAGVPSYHPLKAPICHDNEADGWPEGAVLVHKDDALKFGKIV